MQQEEVEILRSPVKCVVFGKLRDSSRVSRKSGSVLLEKTDLGWRQTALQAEDGARFAHHLHREYVNRESFETVVQEWLPFDFVNFEVEVLVVEEQVLQPMVEEEDEDDDEYDEGRESTTDDDYAEY